MPASWGSPSDYLSGPAVAQAPPQALPGRTVGGRGPWGVRLCTRLLAPGRLGHATWGSGARTWHPEAWARRARDSRSPQAWHQRLGARRAWGSGAPDLAPRGLGLESLGLRSLDLAPRGLGMEAGTQGA